MCLRNLRLQHEVSLLQQQLCESRELIHSLQSELQVYDRVCSSTKANKGQFIHCAQAMLISSHFEQEKHLSLNLYLRDFQRNSVFVAIWWQI